MPGEVQAILQTENQADIAVRNLRKAFQTRERDTIVALQDLNFTVAKGEFISVVGPSGCGKSTLMRIVAGTVGSTEGEVVLRGKPVTGPSPDIGVVFQSPVLFPWLTVLENVLVPARVQRLDPQRAASRAVELLKLAGLDGFAQRYPTELSGGMQQRVSICRSLIHDPLVLLMDEPFGALDAMTREHMNLGLLDIWRQSEKTVLFITHSIPEAVFLSSRVLVMSARPGRILADIAIDLPYPRELDLMGSARFAEYTREIRGLLNARAVGF